VAVLVCIFLICWSFAVLEKPQLFITSMPFYHFLCCQCKQFFPPDSFNWEQCYCRVLVNVTNNFGYGNEYGWCVSVYSQRLDDICKGYRLFHKIFGAVTSRTSISFRLVSFRFVSVYFVSCFVSQFTGTPRDAIYLVLKGSGFAKRWGVSRTFKQNHCPLKRDI
jgi:hypothetical protein